MLHTVEIQSEDTLVLPLLGVDPSDPVIITSISGLDPADVTIFTGDYSRDGGYYQGRRSGGRNPVLNLKLNPNYALDLEVSDIREMLYSAFLEPLPGDDGVPVVLFDDRKPDRYFIGYTEQVPTEIFAKENTAQISMICTEAFLLSTDFVNETEPAGWLSTTINYEGSAKTGLQMFFEVKTAVNTMTIDINGTTMTLNKPSGNFTVGHIIEINTTIGQRTVKVNGVDSMAMVTSGSRWAQLRKGSNSVVTYGAVLGDGKVALVEYKFTPAWWGV